jgi:tetratricopeptide (TPR) repeat protein
VVSWVSCFNDLLATLLLLCSFHAWLNARGAATIPKNAIVGHPESAPAEEGPDFRSEQAGSSPQSPTLGTPEFGMTEDPRRYSRNRLWYGLSLAGYAAALQCKEPAALFPVFLLIFDLSGVQAGEAPAAPPSSFFARLRAALLRLVPFLVVAAIYLLLRRHALGSITTPQVRIISARTEWLTLPSVLLAYLTHLIWPEGLSPLYDVPYVETFSFAAVALPLLTVMLPAGLLLWAAWRSPMARFCFAWMLVFAAPTLHLAVLPRGELVHDRYLYLPMVGLSLLAGLGLAAVMDFQGQSSGLSRAQEAAGRPLFDATWVAGALALALMLVAGRQAGYWRDNFTLFLRGIQIAPNNGIAAGNLGIEFWKRGDREAATALFRRAATLNPDIFEADKRAGYEHYQAGHYAEAEQAFGVAVATRPDDAFSHMMLGLIYLKTRRPAAAVAEGRRAVELAPLDPGFHYGLGNILEATGDLVGARDAYRAELAIRPDHKSSQQELHRIEQILAAAKSQ